MNIARVKQRAATIVTVLVFGYLCIEVLDRMHIVFWVSLPWWGLLLMAVLAFLVIDYLANRLLS